jgi:hypothetical protein
MFQQSIRILDEPSHGPAMVRLAGGAVAASAQRRGGGIGRGGTAVRRSL